jgi:hypothetical protein
MKKYLPPDPRRKLAEIIPFPGKRLPTSIEAQDARIRYLRSIRYDCSQPFDIRMKAAVQLGYEMREKFYG